MLITLGINHRSAPLALREQICFPANCLPQALAHLAQTRPVREAAILSTCNRTELYCCGESPECLMDWLAGYHHLDPRQLQPFLYTLPQAQAVRHAFRVASGLDSMVLGEPQILGQMKQAMHAAEEAGTLGTHLHQLFQRALSVAKEVRSNTAIGRNVVSMAAASVQLGMRLFESLQSCHVLFIGAGDMIKLCAAHFAAQHPACMTIANRSAEQGACLAKRYGARAIRLDELAAYLPQQDIVVSCTASPHPIIGLGLAEEAVQARPHRPLLMVDLAVPRDIEPEVGKLGAVSLHTVDDLENIVNSGHQSRQQAVDEAEAIVAARTSGFLRWLEGRQNVPLIRALRDTGERLRRQEVDYAIKALARGEAAETVLEELSQRLTKKLLHAPTAALHLAEVQAGEALHPAAIRLFRLNE